jgi:hypothetical protein
MRKEAKKRKETSEDEKRLQMIKKRPWMVPRISMYILEKDESKCEYINVIFIRYAFSSPCTSVIGRCNCVGGFYVSMVAYLKVLHHYRH